MSIITLDLHANANLSSLSILAFCFHHSHLPSSKGVSGRTHFSLRTLQQCYSVNVTAKSYTKQLIICYTKSCNYCLHESIDCFIWREQTVPVRRLFLSRPTWRRTMMPPAPHPKLHATATRAKPVSLSHNNRNRINRTNTGTFVVMQYVNRVPNADGYVRVHPGFDGNANQRPQKATNNQPFRTTSISPKQLL